MAIIDTFDIRANRSGRTLKIALAGLMFIAVIAATSLFSASAAGEEGRTLTVTTDADSGAYSLRDILVNLAVDGDVIIFDPSVTTITLTSEISFSKKNITIDGGSGVVITKAAGTFRLLNSTATGSTLTLKGLTIENGDGGTYGDGGGVYVTGNSSLVNCTFSKNIGRNGGGVYARGSSDMTDCKFIRNEATSGGGAYVYTSVVMAGCSFIENTSLSESTSIGGGIYADVNINMTSCEFIGNKSQGNGGGVLAYKDLTATDCVFTGNSALGANKGGGGVSARATAILTDCVITNNSADFGSGIYAQMTTSVMTLTNCTVSGNNATTGNGAAIYSTNVAYLSNTTVTDNNGGGVSVRTTAILTDCVIAKNSAAFGSGIYTQTTTCIMTLTNCTVSCNNTVDGDGAAIYSANAAHLFHTTVTDNIGNGIYAEKNMHLYNSILAGNGPSQILYSTEPGFVIHIVGCLIEGELIPGGTEPITYQDIFGSNTFDLATGLHRVLDGGIAAGGMVAITAADLSATILTIAQQETVLSALEKDQTGAPRPTAAGDLVTCGAVEASMSVAAEETVTTLVSDNNPSKSGEAVTFTAVVKGLLSGADAEGWVEFCDGVALLGIVQLVSGEATFSTPALSTGTHQINAKYLGNEDFEPSESQLSQAVVQSGQPPKHDYSIKASAETGTTISPAGTVTVQSGGKMAFYFSANEGYSILAVMVDGTPLSPADIAKGNYTFSNVKANHTIEVKSLEGSAVTLTVVVAEGKGYIEFSVSGGAFGKYTSPVALPDNSSLILIAYADSGYKFIKWRIEGTTLSDSEISFDDIASSVYLEVYFIEGSTTGSFAGEDDHYLLWGMIGFLLLIMTGFVLWFIFWRRRYYDVHVQGKTAIVGEQRTRRKNEYRFSVKEGYSGGVSYRVGADEQWKPLSPDKDGIYTIPKREVIDDIYLETRC